MIIFLPILILLLAGPALWLARRQGQPRPAVVLLLLNGAALLAWLPLFWRAQPPAGGWLWGLFLLLALLGRSAAVATGQETATASRAWPFAAAGVALLGVTATTPLLLLSAIFGLTLLLMAENGAQGAPQQPFLPLLTGAATVLTWLALAQNGGDANPILAGALWLMLAGVALVSAGLRRGIDPYASAPFLVLGLALLGRIDPAAPAGWRYLLYPLAALLAGAGIVWAWQGREKRIQGIWAVVAATALLDLTPLTGTPQEARVLLFAIPLLGLLPRAGRSWWTALPRYLAGAALIGFPLTAGFGGRAALLADGLAAGQYWLSGFIVLLQMHLGVLVVPLVWLETKGETEIEMGGDGRAWQAVAGPILLALPLLSPRFAGNVGAWLLLLLPAGAGVFLGYRLRTCNVPFMLPELQPVMAAVPRLGRGLTQLTGWLHSTLNRAGLLLEGEGGLLWLLLLVIVFGLARL